MVDLVLDHVFFMVEVSVFTGCEMAMVGSSVELFLTVNCLVFIDQLSIVTAEVTIIIVELISQFAVPAKHFMTPRVLVVPAICCLSA